MENVFSSQTLIRIRISMHLTGKSLTENPHGLLGFERKVLIGQLNFGLKDLGDADWGSFHAGKGQKILGEKI